MPAQPTRPFTFAGSRPSGTSWTIEPDATGDDVHRVRRVLLAVGVLAMVIGIIAVVVPVIASVTIAVFIGWVMVAAGITIGFQAVRHRALLRALESLLTLVAGLYVVIFPLSGTVTLTFVLAVWMFATGVMQLLAAAQLRRTPGAWTTGVGAALSIILGILIVASLPSSAGWAIGLLVGVDLIFWGVRAVVAERMLQPLDAR